MADVSATPGLLAPTRTLRSSPCAWSGVLQSRPSPPPPLPPPLLPLLRAEPALRRLWLPLPEGEVLSPVPGAGVPSPWPLLMLSSPDSDPRRPPCLPRRPSPASEISRSAVSVPPTPRTMRGPCLGCGGGSRLQHAPQPWSLGEGTGTLAWVRQVGSRDPHRRPPRGS